MASVFQHVLSSEDIDYLNDLPDVREAKHSASGRCSIPLTDSIRSALATIGLDLSHTIWHLALENDDVRTNYGIWANGLLVETCSLHFMKNWSNMKWSA